MHNIIILELNSSCRRNHIKQFLFFLIIAIIGPYKIIIGPLKGLFYKPLNI